MQQHWEADRQSQQLAGEHLAAEASDAFFCDHDSLHWPGGPKHDSK